MQKCRLRQIVLLFINFTMICHKNYKNQISNSNKNQALQNVNLILRFWILRFASRDFLFWFLRFGS